MMGQQLTRAEMTSHNAFIFGTDRDISLTRRAMLIAPLLAALPLALPGAMARAGEINPAETAITLPDAIEWSAWSGGPDG